MEKIVVYTSITGKKDILRVDQNFYGAKFIAFTNLEYGIDSKEWNIIQPCSLFNDPRRNSRIHKILSHQYIEAEYSIWIDGNLSLQVPAEELLKFLDDSDIAMFRHAERDCLYDEASICSFLELDDSEVIKKQIDKYKKELFIKHFGLFETGLIVRRHTKKIEEFNNSWWSEVTTFSKRDQISLMYVAKKTGVKIIQIPGSAHWNQNIYVNMNKHSIKREEER